MINGILVGCPHDRQLGAFRWGLRDDDLGGALGEQWQAFAVLDGRGESGRGWTRQPGRDLYERVVIRCDECRLSVPIADIDKIAPVLDRIFAAWPTREIESDTNIVILPLKALADALGRIS